MGMSGYEVATCDVEHLGTQRTVKMLLDRETLEPYFPASIWLLHQYHRKPAGYDALAHHIAAFLTFAQRKGWSPLEITSARLEAYCDKHLFRERGLAASTVRQYHGSIATFYKGMEKLGFVEQAVEVSAFLNEKLQDEINLAEGIKNSLDPFDLYKKYLSEEDFQTLAGSVPTKKARLRRRDELILRVAYETGCRAAEIVDPDNFRISRLRNGLKKAEKAHKSEFLHAITGKGRRAGKPRYIAVPTSLASDILRYVDTFGILGDIPFVSHKNERLHRTHPSRLFKACKDSILKGSSSSTPNLDLWVRHRDSRTFHGLRHTYATNLANKLRSFGESLEILRERMGHASFDTTRVYINFEIHMNGTADEKNAALEETSSRPLRKFEEEES